MKEHVMNKVFRRTIKSSKHLCHLFGECSIVLVFPAFRCKGSKIAFKNNARFKHLPGLKAVKNSHPTERRLAEIRRPVGDKGPNPMPDLHDSHGGEVPDAG